MATAANFFELLELAGEESGEAAVSVVLDKKAAAAAVAEEPPAEEEHQHQQVREGYRSGREENGRGGRGRGQGYRGGRRGGYAGRGYNGGYYNGRGNYYNGRNGYYNYNGNGYYGGDEQGYFENKVSDRRCGGEYREGEMGAGGGNYYNGRRQRYGEDGREQSGRTNLQYRSKQPSESNAVDAEHKPEVEEGESAGKTAQSEASAEGGNGVAAPETENSAGDVAAGESNPKQPVPEDKRPGKHDSEMKPEKKRMNGSLKRKMNKKKLDKNIESKKKTDEVEEQQVVVAEEKSNNDMTLAEYEKVLEEKKKSLDASKSEERKVTAELFKGLQILEKKKADDNAVKQQKAENDQGKGKDGAAKEAKARKTISISELLKPASGEEYVARTPNYRPRRPFWQEDGSNYDGRHRGGASALGNGVYTGRNDNHRGGYQGDSSGTGRAGDGDSGNTTNGAPRGGYSGRRDGYRDRGNDGFRGGYSWHGNGGFRGGYSGRGRRAPQVPDISSEAQFPAPRAAQKKVEPEGLGSDF